MGRPKNRSEIIGSAKSPRVWQVAFYIRLSREDLRRDDESESVSNQRLILSDWLKNQSGDEYHLAGEFVDDGISGTSDKARPAFQSMLRAIACGEVNCVVVKNLARSFRNYSDQGYYLDDYFVRHGTRFVSLYQQSIDTYKDPKGAQNLGIPVQGVLNERHAQDTSESVRRVFDKKRELGQHIGSFAVYGYRKNPENKNALLIDPEAAQVVSEIFAQTLRGASRGEIVRRLNAAGTPCPSAYKKLAGLKYQNPHAKAQPLWSAKTVTQILKNRMYTGDMVQGRHRVRSYKIHLQDPVPEHDWIIAENTHEAIVKKDAFELVQNLLLRDTRRAPGAGTLHLFSGFLRCGKCGGAMCRTTSGAHVYYYCRTYKQQSKSACTSHSVKHGELYDAALQAINHAISAVYPQEILRRLEKTKKASDRKTNLTPTPESRHRLLQKTLSYKTALYEDWKDGAISREDFSLLYRTYCEREALLKSEIAKSAEPKEVTADKALAFYLNHGALAELSRDALACFLDYAEVFENGKLRLHLRIAPPKF